MVKNNWKLVRNGTHFLDLIDEEVESPVVFDDDYISVEYTIIEEISVDDSVVASNEEDEFYLSYTIEDSFRWAHSGPVVMNYGEKMFGYSFMKRYVEMDEAVLAIMNEGFEVRVLRGRVGAIRE